jgi:Eco57I restriction-modification methylase
VQQTALSEPSQPRDEKRAFGAFFTQGNPFIYPAFNRWFSQLPSETIALEPFAGSKQILLLMEEAGFDLPWACYDINPQADGIVERDTLRAFPEGFGAVITNPPYLAKNAMKRSGLDVPLDLFGPYQSLYQTAVALALDASPYVAMIIPESFITTGLFQDRLQHVISLPFKMFDDTDMPTALVLWGPETQEDFVVWRQDERLGLFTELADALPHPVGGEEVQIRFNDPDGTIGLHAADNTREASIRFCPASDIPREKVKYSGRHITRVSITGAQFDPEQLIAESNRLLAQWRDRTQDITLTAFKGLRADGRFRRRLDYASARAILLQALTGN